MRLLDCDQSARERLNRLRDSDPNVQAKLDSLVDPYTSHIGLIDWTYPEPPPAALQEMHEVDRRNLAELRVILQELRQWSGRSLVGDDGAQAAWLIALHADRDRSFQQHCLTLLQDAVARGEAHAWQLQRFQDRLDVAERRKPRHGTIWVPEDFGPIRQAAHTHTRPDHPLA